MGELASERAPCFNIVYDVSPAQRRIPMEEGEWGRLGCEITGTAAQAFREELDRRKADPAEGSTGSACLSDIPFSS